MAEKVKWPGCTCNHSIFKISYCPVHKGDLDTFLIKEIPSSFPVGLKWLRVFKPNVFKDVTRYRACFRNTASLSMEMEVSLHPEHFSNKQLLKYAMYQKIFDGAWTMYFTDNESFDLYWKVLAKRFYSSDVKFRNLECVRSSYGGIIEVANEDFRNTKDIKDIAEKLREVVAGIPQFNSHQNMFYITGFVKDVKVNPRVRTEPTHFMYRSNFDPLKFEFHFGPEMESFMKLYQC